MDPLTIGLAIAGTKKLLESANDLKDIAGGLDKLFHASEAKPKKVDHKKPKTRTQQLLRMKAGDADYDDETSISSVANDILEQKRNEMALHTFEAIKEERAKRIEAKKIQDKKNKEKAAAQKEIDDKYWDNVFAIIKNIAILIGVSIICVIVGWLMVNFGCKEAVC